MYYSQAVISGPLYDWIDRGATSIEVLAVAVILFAVIAGTGIYLARILMHTTTAASYNDYRHGIGRALLLGLEILVAADVIRTVALEPTPRNVFTLSLLVLLRTVLSWSLVVEIEGRWPWQAERPEGHSYEQQRPG